jgi:hypothetical protein
MGLIQRESLPVNETTANPLWTLSPTQSIGTSARAIYAEVVLDRHFRTEWQYLAAMSEAPPFCCSLALMRSSSNSEPPCVSRRAGRGAFPLNAVGYVSRHGDRAKHFVFGGAFDDREGHLDV